MVLENSKKNELLYVYVTLHSSNFIRYGASGCVKKLLDNSINIVGVYDGFYKKSRPHGPFIVSRE